MIDDEWRHFRSAFLKNHFTSSGYAGCDADDRWDDLSPPLLLLQPERDEEGNAVEEEKAEQEEEEAEEEEEEIFVPAINTRRKDGRLSISTKSNVLKLAWDHVPYIELFWKTPVMDYLSPSEGIVRKELMISLSSIDKATAYFDRRDRYCQLYPDQVVTERLLPLARGPTSDLRKSENRLMFPPFDRTWRGSQDTRSLHVGICQKEIECKKRDQRKAFPNCFVFYLRWSRDPFTTLFEESHIKIFSTGKIDMPGLNNEQQSIHVEQLIQDWVFPPAMFDVLHLSPPSTLWKRFPEAKIVLMNAEFQCNFPLQTNALRDLLLQQYRLSSELKNENPGLKCTLYLDSRLPLSLPEQTFRLPDEGAAAHCGKVTYTFFHSGEVLVSGACLESMLLFTFDFIRHVLLTHWKEIRSTAIRQHSKKAKKMQYVSKCKIPITFDHLVHQVLNPTDWRE
jgi:hypothetical protein